MTLAEHLIVTRGARFLFIIIHARTFENFPLTSARCSVRARGRDVGRGAEAGATLLRAAGLLSSGTALSHPGVPPPAPITRGTGPFRHRAVHGADPGPKTQFTRP